MRQRTNAVRDLAGAVPLPRPRTTMIPNPNWKTLPSLQFAPTAWSKLLYLRDRGETEVGGFGLSAADDLLYVEDVRLVQQETTMLTVAFADESVAQLFDEQVDLGRRLEQCGRIWVHTHPGHSADPSNTDEETFARCFGSTDWAVMFILACSGQTYARLRFNVGPGGSLLIPAFVDYGREFLASDQAAWEAEYQANVQPLDLGVRRGEPLGDWDCFESDEELEEFKRRTHDV